MPLFKKNEKKKETNRKKAKPSKNHHNHHHHNDNKEEKKNEEDTSTELTINKQYVRNCFDGIINQLTLQAGGNISDKRIINITGNRNEKKINNEEFYGSHSSIVDFHYLGRCYLSTKMQNSFICFDFIDHRIVVTAYTIKSSNLEGPSCLKSWVLEGSNDNINWIILDLREDETCLESSSSYSPIKTFDVNRPNSQPFRYIKLRMTGMSTGENYCFGLTNMEFFGVYS